MASTRNRQRKLERARAERRLAPPAHRARRKRQIQAGIGAGVALVADRARHDLAARRFRPVRRHRQPVACRLVHLDAEGPASDPDISRHRPPRRPAASRAPAPRRMTIKTNLGDIEATMDLDPRRPAPRRASSYLAGKNYYDDSNCHATRHRAEGRSHCGDPKGDGTGSPCYQFARRGQSRPQPGRLPRPVTAESPALARSPAAALTTTQGHDRHGQHRRRTPTASQFYIVYGDGTDLSPRTRSSARSPRAWTSSRASPPAAPSTPTASRGADGKPKTDLTIQQLVVGRRPRPRRPPRTSASATPPAPADPDADPTSRPAQHLHDPSHTDKGAQQ